MSRPALEGRWPTDIMEAREAAMLARLAEVEPELENIRREVGEARHPWWWALVALIVGGNVGVLVLSQARMDRVIGIFILALVGAAIYIIMRGRRAGKALRSKRGVLDEALLSRVLLASRCELTEEEFAPFVELGAFGRWEKSRFTPLTVEGFDLLHARLTRTERSTDSQGNTQTRTVTVFDGLLFTLLFPAAEGDVVIVLERGKRVQPKGRFARTDPAGRRVKLDRIKTASLEFNRQHTIRTTDAVMAHAVFEPDRTMRFIQMEHDLADATRWGRQAYAMVVTRGRAWVVVPGIPAPALSKFPEGDTLAKALRRSYFPLSLPSVMAHHLRLLIRDTP